jgi:hypothetical protein
VQHTVTFQWNKWGAPFYLCETGILDLLPPKGPFFTWDQ